MTTEIRSSNTEMVSVPRLSLEAARDCLVICQDQAFQSCECESCPQCGLMPDECTDTECSKTCQCTTCERCMNKDSIDSLTTLLAKHAPQPHAEPIAWMVGTAFWWTKEEAERDAAATGLPIVGLGPMPALQGEPAWFMTEGGVSAMHARAKAISDQQGLDTSSYSVPLYTHADPGEVERLRGEVRRLHEAGEFLDNVSQGIEDKLRAQLAEAQALLREADEFMYIMTAHDGHAKLAHRYGKDWWDAIDKLRGKVCTALSASAEPQAKS